MVAEPEVSAGVERQDKQDHKDAEQGSSASHVRVFLSFVFRGVCLVNDRTLTRRRRSARNPPWTRSAPCGPENFQRTDK
jgi:hypothetical protein